MIERLSGNFVRGYTKAIRDIIAVFNYVQPDLQHHKKRFTNKIVMQLLNTILMEREKMRDDWNGFIRWNTKKNDFEWYSHKESHENTK